MTGTPGCSAAVAAGRGRDAGDPAMWAALAPTREAMLSRARQRADEIIAEARRRGEEMVAEARQQARDRMARAREEGRADAGTLAVGVRNKGRRDARSIVLTAQREACEELRGRVRDAVCGLRGGPGYDLLRKQLAEVAAGLAGPGALITEDSAGGVIARAPGIVVDCSLPRLADAAVDTVDVAELWAPERPGTP